MEKDLRSRLKRWQQTSTVWNAVSRFSRLKQHDDHDKQDVEKTVTRVHHIKRIISWLVRAAICGLEIIKKLVVDHTPEDQLLERQKRSKYSQKALMFAITIFVAYLGSSLASPSTGRTAFKVATAAFFVAILIDLISITRSPKWGYALIYLSWIFLVVLSYLLLVSFHKDYRWAIIPVPPLFFAALLHRKLQPCLGQQNTTTSTESDQDAEDIFDTAAAIVNSGGLISMILGHYMYMVGPDHHLTEVSVIGYLFFYTVVLGLYMMMAATVRNAEITPYVGCCAYYLLGILLVATLIATVINVFWIARNGSHV